MEYLMRLILIVLFLIPHAGYAVHPVLIDNKNNLREFKINGALEFDKKRECAGVKASFPKIIRYGEEWEGFALAFGRASLIKIKGDPKLESFLAADFDVPLMYQAKKKGYVINLYCIPDNEIAFTYLGLYYGSGNQPPTIYYVPLTLLK